MTVSYPPVSWHDLLAEPPQETPHWLSAVYGRLRWAHDACGRGKAALGGLDAPMGRHLDGSIRLGRAWGDDLSPTAWDEGGVVAASLPETLGTTAPRLVVVGDLRSPDAPLPFYSRSGKWLWQALRLLGYDELGTVLTNAREKTRTGPRRRGEELGALAEVVATRDPVWLVLGADAHPVIRRLGLSRSVFASHPQAHARFHAKEGPAGYAKMLSAAGLPPGSWHARELIVRAAPAERTLVADAYAIKDGVAHRPQAKPSRTNHQPARAKLEHARRLFVTGRAGTLKAGAEAAGAVYDGVVEVARAERWNEEREEVLRQVRETCKAEMIHGEAKRISSCRDLAWGATHLALARLVERLKEPNAKVFPSDAAKLGSLAVLLSGHAPTTEEQRAVGDLLAKGPEALARELLAWAARMRGEAVPPGDGSAAAERGD